MWAVLETAAGLHVVPDDEAHVLRSDCPCGTRVEWENGRPLVIHGSFDGRETLERAVDLLNPPRP